MNHNVICKFNSSEKIFFKDTCKKTAPELAVYILLVYDLRFHCTCCRFETAFMTIFKISG